MPRRVLLVMDDCGAGDALRLAGHVHSVRKAFPEARVRMVASAGAVAVYNGSPDVDEVIESRLYRRRVRGWTGRAAKAIEVLRLVRSAGVDNDLVITFWWGSRLLSLFARLAGRGPRIGYGDSAIGPYDFRADEMLLNTRLLEAAGVEHLRSQPLPPLAVGRNVERDAHRLLRSSGWDGTAPIAVLHTGSDWACQQWSPSGWADLGDALALHYGAFVAFTGAHPERDYVRRIRALMNQASASLAGETSMAQLAAVMRLARLVVTVDSAAYVVARSEGVPAVVLTGPSHPERLSLAGAPIQIVRRMSRDKAEEIDACKRPRFPDGGCHDYSCPLAGLRELGVADVLEAVRATGALGSRLAAV